MPTAKSRIPDQATSRSPARTRRPVSAPSRSAGASWSLRNRVTGVIRWAALRREPLWALAAVWASSLHALDSAQPSWLRVLSRYKSRRARRRCHDCGVLVFTPDSTRLQNVVLCRTQATGMHRPTGSRKCRTCAVLLRSGAPAPPPYQRTDVTLPPTRPFPRPSLPIQTDCLLSLSACWVRITLQNMTSAHCTSAEISPH